MSMTTLPDTLAIGVIGAGFMSQVAHLPAFGRLAGCRIAALADNRPGLLKLVSESHRVPLCFTDYRDLLDKTSIDAVIVSMPRRAQSAVVRDVLNAGIPVLTEKPLAYTAKVAHHLVALAESGSTRLAVGYMRLFDPGVRLFRTLLSEALADGHMGELLHIHAVDFCGAYTVPVPHHMRSVEPRPFRYPEDPLAPEFLAADLHRAYDYTINVVNHDINLLRDLFGGDLEPISFRIRADRAQHAVLATSRADVALSVNPAEVGTWEQRVDAYFRKGCLSLVLESSLAREACATVIRRRPTSEEILRPPHPERISAFDIQAASFLEDLRNGSRFAAEGADAASDIDTIEALWLIATIGA
jgi:predicted dehydrogenase